MSKHTEISKKDRKQIAKALGLMTQISLTVVCCVAIGIVLGIFLDNRFDTSPVFLLIFLLCGLIAAFKFLIGLSKKFGE